MGACIAEALVPSETFFATFLLRRSIIPKQQKSTFDLIMIETSLRGCFSHAQNNHVSTMIAKALSDVNTFHNDTIHL